MLYLFRLKIGVILYLHQIKEVAMKKVEVQVTGKLIVIVPDGLQPQDEETCVYSKCLEAEMLINGTQTRAHLNFILPKRTR